MSELDMREAGRDDAGLIAQWLNRPEIMHYLSENLRHGGITPMLLSAGLRRGDQLWMLFAPGEGLEPCGLIALDSIEPEDGHANIWFLLGETALAGQGLTSRALDLFCRTNPARLHVLSAWAVAANTASLRCMERAGFEQAGHIREGVLIDGARHDRIIMQRLLG